MTLLILFACIGVISAMECKKLTDPTGNFQSPGPSGSYKANTTTVWCLDGKLGNSAYFNFLDFDLAPGDDLTIYNGNASSQPVIDTFYGSYKSKVVYSGNPETYIVFTSGDTVTSERGFNIYYTTGDTGKHDIDLTHMRLELHSPQYHVQNASNNTMSCSYLLSLPPTDSYWMALSFESVDLQEGQLVIYDGHTAEHVLAKYTGKLTHVQDFIARGDKLRLDLIGWSVSINQTGFSASINAVSKGCSSEINITTEQTFASPDYPSPYPADLKCRMLLQSASASAFKVTFHDFAVADHFDQLTIVDGDSKYSRLIGVYSRNTPLITDGFLLSQAGSLWIEFDTDFHLSDKGFNFTVTPLAFGGAFYDQGNVTLGPGANGSLEISSEETDVYFMLIATPRDAQVYASVISTNMYPASLIEFHDGMNLADPILASLVTEQPHFPVFSNGAAMLVVAKGFLNNGSLTPQFLVLEFNLVYKGGDQILYNSFGDADHFEINAAKDATWMIHNPTVFGIVALKINELVMANASLKVYSSLGNQHLVLQFNDSQDHLPVIYTGVEARVEFTSELHLPDMFLDARYEIVPACNEEFSVAPGKLQSPGYPNQYPYNAHCEWSLNLPKQKFFYFTVAQLNLQPDHKISVYAGNKTTPLAVYNGTSKAPSDIVAPTNVTYKVVFSSESDVLHVGPGFLAEFSAIECGGMFSQKAASLKTPRFPKPPTNATTCVWIIQLPSASKKVQVVSFNFTLSGYRNDSKTSALEFRDGSSALSPIVPMTLKNGANEALASSEHLWVRYTFTPASNADAAFTFQMNYANYVCNETCDKGRCLNPAWKCDRILQCTDGADEANCSYDVPVKKGYAGWSIAVAVIMTFILTLVLIIVAPAVYKRCREGRGYNELRDLMVPVPT